MSARDNSEVTPLLGDGILDNPSRDNVSTNDGHTSTRTDGAGTCISRNRYHLIEIALLLFSFYKSSGIDTFELYLYERVGQSLNLSDFKPSAGGCGKNTSDPLVTAAQKEAAVWLTYTEIAVTIPACLSTLLIGGYSDRGGRKVAMVVPLLGAIVRMSISLSIVSLQLPIYVLVLAAGLEGLSGNLPLYFMAVYAYTSDITSVTSRSVRLTIVDVVIGVGSLIAHFSTGYMIPGLGFFGSYVVNLAVIIVNLLLIVGLLPETVVQSEQQRFLTFKNFKSAIRVYAKNDGTNRRKSLLISFTLMTVVCIGAYGQHDFLMLYMLNSPLCWSTVKIGQYKAATYAIASVGSLVLLKCGQVRLSDLSLLVIGLASMIGADVLYSFATTTTVMYFVPVVGLFSMVTMPLIRSFQSKLVEQTETGAMFSLLAWTEIIGTLVGGVLFSTIYWATVGWFKGFAFLANACSFLLGVILVLVLLVVTRRTR